MLLGSPRILFFRAQSHEAHHWYLFLLLNLFNVETLQEWFFTMKAVLCHSCRPVFLSLSLSGHYSLIPMATPIVTDSCKARELCRGLNIERSLLNKCSSAYSFKLQRWWPLRFFNLTRSSSLTRGAVIQFKIVKEGQLVCTWSTEVGKWHVKEGLHWLIDKTLLYLECVIALVPKMLG